MKSLLQDGPWQPQKGPQLNETRFRNISSSPKSDHTLYCFHVVSCIFTFSFQQHTLWLDCSVLCFPCDSKGSFICAATQMSKVTLVHLKWNQMECMEWSVCLLLAKISSFLIPVKINMTLSVWCFTHTQTSLWVRVGVKGSRFWACVSVGLRNSPDKTETDMHICSFL